MADEQICPKHQGSKHCWHEYGRRGFKGRFESSLPVECCHCGALAVKREHAAEWLEYSPRTSTAGPNG